MSRDREGAFCLSFRFKNRHWLALPLHYVPDCRSDIVPPPQPSSATVPSPSFSIRLVRAALVQSPARVGFEVVHHLLGFRVCLHHGMNVRRPYVRRQKCPLPMGTNLAYRMQHRGTAGRVQQVRSLVHPVALAGCARFVGLNQTMSRNVVAPIHGTDFVAVQMRTIARKRNQVRHRRLVYTLPHGRGSLTVCNTKNILLGFCR
jgi:hypothetical protein